MLNAIWARPRVPRACSSAIESRPPETATAMVTPGSCSSSAPSAASRATSRAPASDCAGAASGRLARRGGFPELAISHDSLVTLLDQLVGSQPGELPQPLGERAAQQLGHLVGVAGGA